MSEGLLILSIPFAIIITISLLVWTCKPSGMYDEPRDSRWGRHEYSITPILSGGKKFYLAEHDTYAPELCGNIHNFYTRSVRCNLEKEYFETKEEAEQWLNEIKGEENEQEKTT